jgi:KipI family sensor histidine kinase inhibitor
MKFVNDMPSSIQDLLLDVWDWGLVFWHCAKYANLINQGSGNQPIITHISLSSGRNSALIVELAMRLIRRLTDSPRIGADLTTAEYFWHSRVSADVSSLMILYDPAVSLFEICWTGESGIAVKTVSLPEPRILNVPVLYGGEFGPDLRFVAEHAHLSVEEVIALHTGRDIWCICLVLRRASAIWAACRNNWNPSPATPRTKIPAGSVALQASKRSLSDWFACGWQLIGRTPLCLFDPQRDPPCWSLPGDYVRFVPIDESTYHQLVTHVQRGEFTI